MSTSTIRLAFRQLIDIHSTTPLEQKIFSVTFAEFGIQQQSFTKGKELYTWAAIREHLPKSQQALPFKVSFSIAGLIGSLDNKIPGLSNALGEENIPFSHHRFALVASDVRDPSAHIVSLTWITGDLTLYGIIGDQLLLSQKPPETFQLKMQPGLSIVSYEPSRSPCLTPLD
jgi:hypothetical protein